VLDALELISMKKLYVGNLPYTATESEVRDLFEKHGDVSSVALATERETGRSLGFGFVEIEDGGMVEAMHVLDGYHMGGRTLEVNEAPDRPRYKGGNGNSRGGRNGHGGEDNNGC